MIRPFWIHQFLFSTKKRRLFLGLGILLILITIVHHFYTSSISGQITIDTLSNRAQAFLESERKKSSSSWRSTSFEKETSSTSAENASKTISTPCYNLELPFDVRYQRKDTQKNCQVQMRITASGTRVLINVEPFTDSLEEHPSVQMRQTFTNLYTPQKIQQSTFQNVLVFEEPDGVSFFTQKDGELITIVFSETQSKQVILDQHLPELIKAFTYSSPAIRQIE